jgi:hypothetical protein
VTGAWREQTLADLLAEHGLADAPEAPFPTDGWSGATFTTLTNADGGRYVLKRTSLAIDWIARATNDTDLREAWIAAMASSPGVVAPFASLGAAADGEGAAILMPELAQELIAWERPGYDPVIEAEDLDRVLAAVAGLHDPAWHGVLTSFGGGVGAVPWCPLPDRLRLLTWRSAAGYADAGNPVGDRFLAGWDAFDRLAPAGARAVIDALTADVTPLVDALARLPFVLLHGDLKLANVALLDHAVAFIDWQMFLRGPVAVDLGWLLVSNSGSLPLAPEAVLERYRAAGPDTADWDAQVDLAMMVGLLLRGWRKGLDAEADAVLASGVRAADDLAWWCDRVVEAAGRRL